MVEGVQPHLFFVDLLQEVREDIMKSQRDHRNFVKGYQECLVDIITAADEGGLEGVLEWVRNNGDEYTRNTMDKTLHMADNEPISEFLAGEPLDKLPPGDYLVTTEGMVTHRDGTPVSLTEEARKIIVAQLEKQRDLDLRVWEYERAHHWRIDG